MIYFISDTHFFHSLAAMNRGFDSSIEMDEFMIYKWNSVIAHTDDVFVLGDFAFDKKAERIGDLLLRLNGKIHLVLGNHDHFVERLPDDIKKKLCEICKYKEIKYQKKKFILFHYPLRDWNFKRFGAVHLHGHNHITEYEDNNILNVSADLLDYVPIGIDDVLNRIKDRRS